MVKKKIVPLHGKKIYEAEEPKFSYFPDEDDHMMDYNENLLNVLKIFLILFNLNHLFGYFLFKITLFIKTDITMIKIVPVITGNKIKS